MKRPSLLSVLLVVVAAAPAAAEPFEFLYHMQGFVYSAGSFQFFDMPGPPTDINDAGQIVGMTAVRVRGYLYDAGSFSYIGPPGQSTSTAYGINNAGDIVGSSSVGGYLYGGGIYSPVNMPGAPASTPTNINDAGQIVGTFSQPPLTSRGMPVRGYRYDGAFTTIDVPGAKSTYLTDINDSGQIVGHFVTEIGGPSHAFFRDVSGSFAPIEVPGAYLSFATGISDAGLIVGRFSDGKNPRSFLYDGVSFSSIDLPGYWVFASGINDAGQVVGFVAPIPAPEPGSILLLGSGLAGVWAAGRRRHRTGGRLE